jgi:hypothetical protein
MQSLRNWGISWTLLATMALAGCGGDVSFGGVSDGSGSPRAAGLTLIANTTSLASDASTAADGVELTAIVVDENNNTLEGVKVSFTASSGALAVENDVSAADGTVTAVLTTGGNETLRTITVNATTSGGQDSIDVAVIQAPSPADVRVGVLEGDTFTSGVISIGQSPLAAGGSSGLRVDLVDVANSNSLYNVPTSVAFTSSCVSQGLATITSPVESVAGSANATYQTIGCGGSDLITATATLNGNTLIATGTIQVSPAALGSIEFVSAEPTTIGITGTGLPETSTIIFKVRNSSGGPVPNQTVNFTLNTNVGGIQLSPSSGTTNNAGLVQTVVRSGTIHTSVRVTATATADGNTISSQSELLVITTGIPDQDSFSLSAECLNVEGLSVDGTEVPLTLRAADRFNNPVPDGTGIAFTAEGGSVVGSCSTLKGACSVNWVSQNPRPASDLSRPACRSPLEVGGATNGTDAACANGGRAGRATILASAVGEESFIDKNGNGFFDVGEVYEDLPEAFLDKNENNARQDNEEFLDFNVNAAYSGKNNLFSGVLCAAGGTCDPAKSLHVRDDLVVIMSGSSPNIANASPIANCSSPLLPGNDICVSGGVFSGGSFIVTAGGVMFPGFVVRDFNDQPMPSGTTISVSASGDAGAFEGTTSFTVPCQIDDTAEGNFYGFTFAAEDTPAAGSFELNVTTPGGLTTVYSFSVSARPQCSDLIDNDGTGGIDFPADADCTSAADGTE